jgi:hypothetical protein
MRHHEVDLNVVVVTALISVMGADVEATTTARVAEVTAFVVMETAGADRSIVLDRKVTNAIPQRAEAMSRQRQSS